MSSLPSPEWIISPGLTDYATALADMEARAAAIHAGEARERIWLLEHPPLYTAGTSADPAELLDPRFPVFEAGRGGRYTYHGPGQRIGYVLLDLATRARRARLCRRALEGWVIAALARLVSQRGVPPGGSASGPTTSTAARPRSARSACACGAG